MKEEKKGLYELETQNCIPTDISTCEKGIYKNNRMKQVNGGQ